MSSSRLAQGLPMFRPLQRLLSRATLACALGAMVLALAIPARAEEEQALIDRARITVEGFTAQTDMVEMRRLLAKARGVFVAAFARARRAPADRNSAPRRTPRRGRRLRR